jgi:hypothetical protein
VGLPPRARQVCNKMQAGVAKLFALAGLGPVMPMPSSVPAAILNSAPGHHVAHMHGEGLTWHDQAENREPIHRHDWYNHIDPISSGEDGENRVFERPRRPHHFHGGHFRHMHHHGSFLRRIHRALMSLGPWEGRAVAFVLGCGIGVLLRMLWILVVVAKRAVRGESEDELDTDVVECERVGLLLPAEDAEELFIAPPEYRDDEKAPLSGNAKN